MTGYEYFITFGPKIAKMCIEASIESQNEKRMNENKSGPIESIMDCITWSMTKQGAAFWNGFINAFAPGEYDYADGGKSKGRPVWNEGNEMGVKARANYENYQRTIS